MLPNIFCNLLARTPRMFPVRRLMSTSSNLYLKFLAETTAKAQRRQFLERQILLRAKIVVKADKRQLTDTIVQLKKQGKCAGVIRRSGYDDVDVVLPGKQMRSFIRKAKNATAPIYIRVDGQDIRCIIKDIKLHGEKFIQKVQLVRFIEGEPNEIQVPLLITHLTSNSYYNHLATPKIYQGLVKLITYNEDYPACLTVDVSYVSPMRPYKFADLANLMPPGIELSPNHNPSERIISFGEPEDIPLEEIQEVVVYARSFSDEDEMQEEDEEDTVAQKTIEEAKSERGGKKKKQS